MHHTQFIQELRQAGHRLTPQREAVLSVICDCEGHIAADAILKRIRKRYPYINKSAVYRTLDLLARLGFVNPTDFGQGRVEYEVHQHPHHHHLLCRNCHQMVEVDERVFAPLERALRTDYGFTADLDHFAIFGLCRKCQKAVNRRQ
ncbi:MAG: transcriptional repressor [Chloroflexota bacterium]|nr:transcriptional repressor [Chloroflexota bacterium]